MNLLDDPALMELIAQKSEAGLSELYDRYHRLVFSIAFGVIGRMEDAEEITLDVFTRIWHKADTYQVERAGVRTWLSRLARNRAIDVLRRESVRPMQHSIGWAEAGSEPLADGPAPEAAVQLAMQQRRVRRAIGALPRDQQVVLALAFFKGYSHSEIAGLLDLPLGTVKGRIRAGMQALRLALADEIGGPG
jgi:RNA polymerase sigma-70 factor (ECF subfamily)